jgi:hypothetical protein
MGAASQRSGDGSVPTPTPTGDRTGVDDDETTAVDVGTACKILGNRRRRYALHCLKQQENGTIEMGDLSTQVAAWEIGIDPEQVSYDERKRVHTSLYQHHAPKLDEQGIVEYDARSGLLELTDAGEDVDLYLEAVQGRDVPWASYLLGVSAVGLLVTLAAYFGFIPASVPPTAPGIATGVGFFISSAVFVYDNRNRMRLGCEGPPPELGGEVDDQ